MKQARPKLLAIIIILCLINGVWGVIRSFPIYSLYTSIKRGGVTVTEIISVEEVQPNTPAAAAQIMAEDKILSINGSKVTAVDEFVGVVNENQGKEVSLVYERNGSEHTAHLVSRINPPPGEGRLGLVLTDTGIENKPLIEIIPYVIIRSYSGFEETPSLFVDTNTYHDNRLTRLKSLFFGIITLIIGIGLWRWRPWAWCGYPLMVGYEVIASFPYLSDPAHYRNTPRVQSLFTSIAGTPNLTDTLIVIFGLGLDLCLAYYVYKQKRLFR